MENLLVDIRLSFQRALLRNISKNVRGICCDWDDNKEWFKIIFYLDIVPNEDERELQSVIMTEFHNDFQDFKKFFEECIFSKEPYEKLNKLRLIVFWRHEGPVF
jgi:hypothetical protein